MQLSKPPKPKATRKRLKKEILSDDFKKRKIFWKNIEENFPPHITNPSATDTFTVDSELYLEEMCVTLIRGLFTISLRYCFFLSGFTALLV
jgi:hypothetical protein